MSFAASWLALREAADGRARNPALLARVSRRFGGRERIAVVDLGCGTGSNLRAFASALPPQQDWLLVDHDGDLLAAARERLSAWADRAEEAGGDLMLAKGAAGLRVRFAATDLAAGAAAVIPAGTDLVTAAALFDLVSATWIGDFARAVAAHGAVFYAALNYDGTEEWRPPHPADEAMRAAFLVHQGRDKGFGPAVGRAATRILCETFSAAGYRALDASSPWCLAPHADAALIAEIAAGIAAAVRETGLVVEKDVAAWLASRLAGAEATIGHRDCLALPPP